MEDNILVSLKNSSVDILMDENQARQILEFIKKHLSDVKLIVCQCEQGMSRSPAIAGALSRILQNEDEYFLKNYWAEAHQRIEKETGNVIYPNNLKIWFLDCAKAPGLYDLNSPHIVNIG